jgi:hypothetical protein
MKTKAFSEPNSNRSTEKIRWNTEETADNTFFQKTTCESKWFFAFL